MSSLQTYSEGSKGEPNLFFHCQNQCFCISFAEQQKTTKDMDNNRATIQPLFIKRRIQDCYRDYSLKRSERVVLYNKQFQDRSIALNLLQISMGQQNTKSNLFIKIIIGETQSHELFDFQNGGIQQEQKLVKSPFYLINRGETVEYHDEQTHQNGQQSIPEHAVYKITQDQYQQITIKDLGNSEQRTLWRIIKNGEAFPLKTGDMLKIGKIKIELKKIVQKRQQGLIEQQTVKDAHDVNDAGDLQSLRSNHSNCDRCRICFRSYNNKTDPLLCLCKCSGSIKYIHFMCLKDWISNSISKRQDEHCKFYTYQQIFCELCKNTVPTQFKHEGRNYSFLDFTAFEPPYAEFEYSQMENGKRKFHKYIINLSKDKEVHVGRNNSSQVVLKDISISRTHCSLEYKHGMLLVRDKKSKFGTLIKVDKNLQFNSEQGLQLQFDSKIIQLYKQNSFKNCCCSDVDNYRLIFEADEEKILHFLNSNGSEPVLDRRQLEQNIEIIRLSSNEISEMQSVGDLLEEGLRRDQNNSERNNFGRNTMIRQTIARDQAIRY